MDDLLISILKDSALTIWAVILLLKGCAAVSPWEWDNTIVDAIDEIFCMLLPPRRKRE